MLDGQKTTFRDLNKNGKMDIYEDIKLPLDARVEDLLSQMNIEEKPGKCLSAVRVSIGWKYR
ncbi:MAG: hypothetical protein IPJ13_32175 [Saprospiraceae bacterium]|nr:hypothetical protein [Saprospiraceae bacterium]